MSFDHAMRRRDRLISSDECLDILRRGEYGILATADAEGQPYAVPLSYVLLGGRIYFHCAREGHKIENLRQNPKVSLAVVGQVRPVFSLPAAFGTYFESVVVFGKLWPAVDGDEKYRALQALANKYLSEHVDQADEAIQSAWNRTLVYALEPEKISGKARRE